jgi:hypothetical protein
MSIGTECDRAIERAVAFLDSERTASGEIRVLASSDPTLMTNAAPDPSLFPTAIAAHALSFCREAADLHAAACRFLLAEQDRRGLWSHWPRGHPHHAFLPPDLDDTSCASAALAHAGFAIDNRAVLLGNRRADGMFLTWVIPRLRHAGDIRAWPSHVARLPALYLFFRDTSAAPGDVDFVVNANVLFYLREFDSRDQVIDPLLAMLRDGRESQCDKWYENRFVVRYFVSRALRAVSADAARLFGRDTPQSALDHALAICVALDWGQDAGHAAIEALIALQSADGSWPRAALYHGGRARRRDGTFGPRHPDTPHWGSEALTTCLCLEALSRWRQAAGE